MKSMIALSLLALAASPFASADLRVGDHSTSGKGVVLLSSGPRGILNARISGAAAKILFDNMTRAKETTRRMGSLFLTDRQSSQLLCSFSAEVAMTYGCSFHVNARGEVAAGNVRLSPNDRGIETEALAASAPFGVQGEVFAGGERGTINVNFSGEAAKALFDRLTAAREESRRIGSLLLTDRRSDDLLVTFSAEVALSYEALFHVGRDGRVEADNVMFTM